MSQLGTEIIETDFLEIKCHCFTVYCVFGGEK